MRTPLASEAIRLTRLVTTLLGDRPETSEVRGLLALLQFQHSRAAARLDAHGDLVLWEDQDRALWDAESIDDALAAVTAAEQAARRWNAAPGPYLLQARIAREYATTTDAADFRRIADLYETLMRIAPSPVVEMNRAVAVGFADGPAAGLAVLDALDDPRLDRHHLLHAVRAGLLERAGRLQDALPHYVRALELAPSAPERRFLDRRIAAITARDTHRR